MSNFSLKEISCRCGCGQRLNRAAIIKLEETRKAGGDRPIHLTSAARCESHNALIKGASPVSLHMYDMAVDVKKWGPWQAYDRDGRAAIAALFRQCGWYVIEETTWVHADLRTLFPELLKIRGIK